MTTYRINTEACVTAGPRPTATWTITARSREEARRAACIQHRGIVGWDNRVLVTSSQPA